MLPCSIPKRVRVSHIPGNVNQYCCDYTTLFQTETWKDWHQPTTISWEFRRMSSINNLSQYVYIENLPFRWVCMWYRHVCTEQKYVHTRNVFLPVNYTNTRTHTHLGISYITATHRKLCSIHVPRLQAYYVCACDFGHFICFFGIRCMYWKHTLFRCLFFWLSQLLHQLCHWAPKSAVVDDRSCKKLSIQYFGISASFKQFHANLIGPKHFVRTASNYSD